MSGPEPGRRVIDYQRYLTDAAYHRLVEARERYEGGTGYPNAVGVVVRSLAVEHQKRWEDLRALGCGVCGEPATQEEVAMPTAFRIETDPEGVPRKVAMTESVRFRCDAHKSPEVVAKLSMAEERRALTAAGYPYPGVDYIPTGDDLQRALRGEGPPEGWKPTPLCQEEFYRELGGTDPNALAEMRRRDQEAARRRAHKIRAAPAVDSPAPVELGRWERVKSWWRAVQAVIGRG